jgi:hypothetical protein
MPKRNDPPKPTNIATDQRDALFKLKKGDSSPILDKYSTWWHQSPDKRKLLGFAILANSLLFKAFTKDSFSDWRSGKTSRITNRFQDDLSSLANYLWNDLRTDLQSKREPVNGADRPNAEFIQGWYDAIDHGASLLESVRKHVPGIYRVYRVSTFNPKRITVGAMLVWACETKLGSALRTVEINRCRLDGTKPTGKPKAVLSEVYFGAAIRKKSWLLIDTFLDEEGDPHNYRFALPHDRLIAKYECLPGHYLAFPTAPFALPTIRGAVLERLEAQVRRFESNTAALRYLEANVDQWTTESGRVDLVNPQELPQPIVELLDHPLFAQGIVLYPENRVVR